MKNLNYVLTALLLTLFISCSEEDFKATQECTLNGQAINCSDTYVSAQASATYDYQEQLDGSLLMVIDGTEGTNVDEFGNRCNVGIDGEAEFKVVVSDDGQAIFFGEAGSGNSARLDRVGAQQSMNPLIGKWGTSEPDMTLSIEFLENGQVVFNNRCLFEGL